MRELKQQPPKKIVVRESVDIKTDEDCPCTNCRLNRLEEQILYIQGLLQGFISRFDTNGKPKKKGK